MSGFLTAVIIISAIFIVIAVIMQPSKDGGLGGLASGGVTDSVFGTNRNEFLAKTTWWLLAIFLISSLVLAKHKTREHNETEREINTRSLVEEVSGKKADVTLEDAKDDAGKALKEAANDLKAVEDKTAEEIKKDAVTIEEKVDKTVEEIKKEAIKVEEKAEEVKPESGK